MRTDGQRERDKEPDRQTDMTKQTAAFRNFENASENCYYFEFQGVFPVGEITLMGEVWEKEIRRNEARK